MQLLAQSQLACAAPPQVSARNSRTIPQAYPDPTACESLAETQATFAKGRRGVCRRLSTARTIPTGASQSIAPWPALAVSCPSQSRRGSVILAGEISPASNDAKAPSALHIKREIIGSFFATRLYAARSRKRIKCGVDLNKIEMFRVPAKPILSSQTFWIPILDKSGISPTRGADANFTHGPDNCFI